MPGALLHCPIRGPLNVSERAADGFVYTEEKRRIDCIRFLLEKGYPPSHFKIETVLFRFGHKGRNSFRTDLSITDAPVSTLPHDFEQLKPHIKLIAEIKRDNADSVEARRTQVYPALSFLPDISAYGIYWDDVEQRLFYRTLDGTTTTTHEYPVAVLPPWGQGLHSPRLQNKDLRPTILQGLFVKIENRMHTEINDKSRRFEVMLQLLLVNLYDEYTHHNPQQEMAIQDFGASPLNDADVKKKFEEELVKAVRFYGHYLPNPVPTSFALSGSMLRSLSTLLGPIKILGTKRDVVQDFYMYFAKGVYKWDLAQYFTPSEVVDFIVRLVNPHSGDTIKDPACGSGDFLISALHTASRRGDDLRDAVWGADNSDNAVQVCVLNMVLNGDGKSHIKNEDSLERIETDIDRHTAMLCNPPFGVKIVENRFDVLSKKKPGTDERLFEMGYEWSNQGGTLSITDKVLKRQETGLLFAELCVRQASSGGRIGIILPNGYLGNRSIKYTAFREWLLRNTRLVAVIGFPRFTFKKSGADVSASVLLLEKRSEPLQNAADTQDYPFYAGIVESVGWSVSDSGGNRIFKRDEITGTILTDENNEALPDADFERVLSDLYGSPVCNEFPWVRQDIDLPADLPLGWSVNIRDVVSRYDRSIDPKRWCQRAATVREQIQAMPHFSLDEVLTIVPEVGVPTEASSLYRYVELTNVSDGVVTPTVLRGWELPDRAKHRAERGEIFVGSVWGSVGKWFVAGGNCDGLIATNGLLRLRLRPGMEEYLTDIVVGLNTEAYRIQARSYATGSDGLAELQGQDLLEIVLPRITDVKAREIMRTVVDALLEGRTTVATIVDSLREQQQIPAIHVTPRSSNWVQV